MQQRSDAPLPERAFILLLLAIASIIIYSIALLRFPLVTLYTNLRYNLDDFTMSDIPTGIAITSGIGLLFASYILGAITVRSAARHHRLVPVVIVAVPLVCTAILLLTQPATSVDIYDYLFRGRMVARYQANTFVQVPRDFESDPLFKQVAWRNAVTAYGPLWERMSWLTARLAGESPAPAAAASADTDLLRLMLAYKGLAVLGFLLCGTAIWAAVRHISPRYQWLGVYLWLWNPLALWESAAAAHNDAWMMLMIVLAAWALAPMPEHRQPGEAADQAVRSPPAAHTAPPAAHPASTAHLAFLALVVGGLIKYLALFFGPVALTAALRRLPSWRDRLKLVLISGLVCAALIVVAYAQFWVGPDTLKNISARGDLFNASWLASLQHLLVGVVSEEAAKKIASRIGLLLLVPGVLWSAWRGWRAPHDVAGHMLWLLIWFLFVCNPWFQPWYALWPLALVALQPWRTRLVRIVILFCVTAMLSYSAVAFLLPALTWAESSAAWNALVSVLIYVPPLLVLGWSYRDHGAAAMRAIGRFPRMLGARIRRGTVTP